MRFGGAWGENISHVGVMQLIMAGGMIVPNSKKKKEKEKATVLCGSPHSLS